MKENNENKPLAEGIDIYSEVTLPVIPMRAVVAFPKVQVTVELSRPISLKAFTEAATSASSQILLFAQQDVGEEDPDEGSLYGVGVLAKIKHVSKSPQGALSVVFEGLARAKMQQIHMTDGYLTGHALIKKDVDISHPSPLISAMMQDAKGRLERLLKIHPSYNEQQHYSALAIASPGFLADFAAFCALIDYRNKQNVLEQMTIKARLEALLVALGEEETILTCEAQIQAQVKEKIDRNQKEYFLREQIKAIQAELGEDEEDDEIREYGEKILAAHLPEEVEEKFFKELNKLAKTPFGAAEGTVIRSYLDTGLEFPFGKRSEEPVTVAEARAVLDADHDGLETVKERILEFVAVKEFSPDVKNQILCLVGPPGVGKTSVAASIARALHRSYARISLGGMHDEAEIRGHRKTYVGAMPGRIVTALIQAKTQNPVIVLDEIDKLSNNFRGDPTSALLEVLDPEQNKFFRDNFMEIPIDLSDCLFIATANSRDAIPLPLLDRMEIIELSTYTDSEKLSIAKNHLLPKQLKRNGMTKSQVRIDETALLALITGYTREAGVRTLERKIATLIRKGAKFLSEHQRKSVTITEKNIARFLGKRRFFPEAPEATDPIGVVNGLAYTQTGGDLLKVEVAVLEGSGKIELTGSLGDVMKESAKIAHSYVRSLSGKYPFDKDFYKKNDLHIHFPEGAIPKDGPSAGVTMVTAMLSALCGIPVKRDVAMTGEITLRGKVLPIGGLKEKSLAAYRSGIHTVLIPTENQKDLEDIDKEARAHLTFLPCATAEDVLKNALAMGK